MPTGDMFLNLCLTFSLSAANQLMVKQSLNVPQWVFIKILPCQIKFLFPSAKLFNMRYTQPICQNEYYSFKQKHVTVNVI